MSDIDEMVTWLNAQVDYDQEWAHGDYEFSSLDGVRTYAEQMLRDVEAKRRILRAWPDPMGQWSADQADAGREVKERVLRLLAAAYSGRPGYRQEWAA